MHNIYAIYGASGCGRSLMPIAINHIKREMNNSAIYFIDDNITTQKIINGYQSINYQQFNKIPGKKNVLIAISNSKIRQKIHEQLINHGVNIWSIQSDSCVIMDEVYIDEGCALSPFVTIGSNVSIGKCFHANLYSYVEHDCIIGDYVTFAPRVSCNGNVHIGNHAYIGAGALIKQGTPGNPLMIGEGAIIGMGAVVTKDVPAGVTVVGNPARVLIK